MGTNKQAEMLINHEGEKFHVYQCPAGYATIGVGRNVDSNGGKGITLSESRFLLKNDIKECQEDLKTVFQNFDLIPPHIQDVLVDMRFNLGPGRFRKFKKMIAATSQYDYAQMVIQMRDSLWYNQVPNRADNLIAIVERGHRGY